jgi:hypothetical protein
MEKKEIMAQIDTLRQNQEAALDQLAAMEKATPAYVEKQAELREITMQKQELRTELIILTKNEK